jgi:hypothetical protein
LVEGFIAAGDCGGEVVKVLDAVGTGPPHDGAFDSDDGCLSAGLGREVKRQGDVKAAACDV